MPVSVLRISLLSASEWLRMMKGFADVCAIENVLRLSLCWMPGEPVAHRAVKVASKLWIPKWLFLISFLILSLSQSLNTQKERWAWPVLSLSLSLSLWRTSRFFHPFKRALLLKNSWKLSDVLSVHLSLPTTLPSGLSLSLLPSGHQHCSPVKTIN